MKKKKEHETNNIFGSYGLVFALGASFIILGILRWFGLEVPLLFLLGISISALGLILIEFFNIQGKLILIMQLSGLFSIICLPNLNFMKKIDIAIITNINDGLSLIIMGLTIVLLSQKGLKEIHSIVESNTETIESMAASLEKAAEMYQELVNKYKDLKEEQDKKIL
ncbi:hypothetical protein [Paenibacillus sp. Root444D2]|uniref:hypothetical protein n=1 Tax=Paenibacillus sp. Root444D2 TaxID=1736538 RepID=UPI0012E3C1E2|nr:hypothetical protein [Paenibacillus sp. Root444D2]